MSGRWEGKEIREEDFKKYLDMVQDPEKFGEYLHTAMHSMGMAPTLNKAHDPMDHVVIHFQCTVSEAIQLCFRLEELRGHVQPAHAVTTELPRMIMLTPDGKAACRSCEQEFENVEAFAVHKCTLEKEKE